MIRFLPRPILVPITFVGYCFVFVVLGAYVFPLAPLKLIRNKALQDWLRHAYRQVPNMFTTMSTFILSITAKVQWDIHVDRSINKLKSYILIANHSSMMDIIVVQKVINRIAPPSVYFVKSQLMFVPIIGWGCWLLSYPIMKRYSKAYLARYPHKRGEDIKRTKKSCKYFTRFPVTMINFLEGTRFNKEKHDKQQSPYKNLLKPRAGGIAHAMYAMGDQVKDLLNVTIVYPQKNFSFYDVLTGNVKKVTVYIEALQITPKLRGDYNVPQFRQHFQEWLNQLWIKKDSFINEIKAVEGQVASNSLS